MRRRTAAAAIAFSMASGVVPFGVAHAGSTTASFGVRLTIVPATSAASDRQQQPTDPLAGGTWQAVSGPWPGTMHFDAVSRIVHIALIGAQPVDAAYSYALQPPAASGPAGPSGRLHIQRANGLTADFVFTVAGGGTELAINFERTGAKARFVHAAVKAEPDDARSPQSS